MKISKVVWKYLKTVLFSCIVLTQPFIDHLSTLIRKNKLKNCMKTLREGITDVLDMFASLHFITMKFGDGGIIILEKQWKILISSLLVPIFLT